MTMRMFRSVRQVAASAERPSTLFGRVRHLAAPGEKYTVSSCVLFVFYLEHFSSVRKLLLEQLLISHFNIFELQIVVLNCYC